jgi:hypothetical protein
MCENVYIVSSSLDTGIYVSPYVEQIPVGGFRFEFKAHSIANQQSDCVQCLYRLHSAFEMDFDDKYREIEVELRNLLRITFRDDRWLNVEMKNIIAVNLDKQYLPP